MVLFLQRVGDQPRRREPAAIVDRNRHRAAAGDLATPLIELGSRRARGESANGLTIASLVTMTLSVRATAVAATMLGVS